MQETYILRYAKISQYCFIIFKFKIIKVFKIKAKIVRKYAKNTTPPLTVLLLLNYSVTEA